MLWESVAAQRNQEDLGSLPSWRASIGLSCMGWGGAILPQVTAAVVQMQTASTYSGAVLRLAGTESVRATVYVLCVVDGTEPEN